VPDEKLMDVNGQCFCGAITYRADIDTDRIVVCHCTDCQQMSGSAFEAVAVTDCKNFELLSGHPRMFVKRAGSGRDRELAFCETCGTRLYGQATGDNPETIALRLGTIEQRAALTPRVQLWCCSALSWALIDSIPGIDGQTL